MAHCQISWNSYMSNICKGFSQLQQSEQFVDMTLAADGHLVKVHKNLLALASPYIKEMMQSAPCPHPVIFLNNISHEILGYIIEYVYMGQVEVPLEEMDKFLQASKALDIVGVNSLAGVHAKTALSKDKNASNMIKRKRKYGQMCETSNANISEDNSMGQENDTRDVTEIDSNLNDNAINYLVEEKVENLPSLYNEISGIKETHRIMQDTQNVTQSDTDSFLYEVSGNALRNISIEDFTASHHSNDLLESKVRESNAVPNSDNNNQPLVMELDYTHPITAPDDTITHADVNQMDQSIPETMDFSCSHYDNFLKMEKSNELASSEVAPKKNYSITIELPEGDLGDPKVNLIASTAENLPTNTSTDDPTPLFRQTSRGSIQMILNRFVYYSHHSSRGGQKRRWRCIDYRHKHCKAFVDTNGELIVNRKFAHNHQFHDDKIVKAASDPSKPYFSKLSELILNLEAQDKCNELCQSEQNNPIVINT